jgi:ornithine cyclodeaminase/alanine dehydrogenase-like protein (mu-crystallin family)
VKTAYLSSAKKYIVAKLNANFPQNYRRFGKPTIQGVIVLYDADNGRLLAVLDSMEITIRRTAAASAVAAKYLARQNSSVATICGCGEQARAHLRALSLMFRSEKFTHSISIQAHRCVSLRNYRANFR